VLLLLINLIYNCFVINILVSSVRVIVEFELVYQDVYCRRNVFQLVVDGVTNWLSKCPKLWMLLDVVRCEWNGVVELAT